MRRTGMIVAGVVLVAGIAVAVAVVQTQRPSSESLAPTTGVSETILAASPVVGDSQVSLAPTTALTTAPTPITICSFNIKFLGHYKDRDHQALANLMAPYDLVVIQELVAPPVSGTYPDGTPFRVDPEAAEFLRAMQAHGFTYWLSEEDTGSGDEIHDNGPATEWWIACYKPERVTPAKELPHGFLAEDRSNHPDYERVPYAFSFRTADRTADLVMISVHLQPSSGPANRARRAHELASISHWIDQHDTVEHDFLILGDMNLENAKELVAAIPPGFTSLNDECRATNVSPKTGHPYDQVFFRPTVTREIDTDFDMRVINLIDAMRPSWKGPGAYPGDPFQQGPFERYASDHHPVVFRLRATVADDD